jgi:hypothetical protein
LTPLSSVAVNNFPATQPVSGTVAVSNFPATQPVSGTVAATQSGTWTVGVSAGQTIAVTNTGTFAVQAAVTGTVAVSNPFSGVVTNAGTFAVQVTNTPAVTLASTTVTNTVAENLTQVGGAAFALGQQLAASSLPVVLTAAQIATLTPLTTVAVTQGTSPWVVSLASTTVTNTVAENLIQVAGVTLGATAVVNYGSTPAAVAVPAVNAFITNTPAVTLASTTITGTVSVTQGTSPWVVSLTSTTVTNTVAENLIQVAGVTLGATAVTAYGTPPAAANVPGVNAFITNTPAVTLASTTITGTVSVTQGTSPWVVSNSGTFAVQATVLGALTNNNAAPAATLIGVLGAIAETAYATVTYTTGDMVLPVTDLHGALNSDLQAVAGVALGPTALVNYGSTPAAVVVPAVNAFITNAVPITFSTAGGVVQSSFTGTSLNVNVTNATQVVLGALTNNNAAPAATNLGVLPAIAETAYATVTYNTGDQVLPVTDLHGALNQDLQAVAGVALGATAVVAYGSTPAAVIVPAVNAFITNTPAVTLTSTTITGTSTIAGNKTNNTAVPGATNLGVLPAIASTAWNTNTYTNAFQVAPTTDLSGALWVDLGAVAGAAIVASAAGVQKVGISGATGATLDAVTTAATAPASGLAVLEVYNSTAPSLTTGQSVALQSDYVGSQFVKPYRRSQTAASKAIISSSAVAVTVMPAQAAGIFADISSLVVTVVPAASVSLPFTLTLSDGTATYIWDMETGALATSSADGTILNFTFNPPLSATTAATAWTIATNVSTVVVHATAIAVLQKAS